MVNKSPLIRVIPLPNGRFMACKWGLLATLSPGVILQVAMDFNVYMVRGIFVNRNYENYHRSQLFLMKMMFCVFYHGKSP